MPGWYLVLEAAAEWSRPPWEIAQGNRVIWWLRWRFVRNEKARIANQRAKQAELNAMRRGY